MTVSLDERARSLADHRIHDENHEKNFARLQGFYGRVARRQDDLIVQSCLGQRVLDVGAGYGTLTRQLFEGGKEAVAIDVDPEKIEKAREWFGVEVRRRDFLRCEEDAFDTVVFREVLNHLDLNQALAKAFRVARRQVIVFQGTEHLPLRLAKSLYRHREYEQKRPRDILEGLRQAGFLIEKELYLDVVAFPLSGGWRGPCLVPPVRRIENAIMKVDGPAQRLLEKLGLSKSLCFRFLVSAVKT